MPSDTPTNPPPPGPQSTVEDQAALTRTLLDHEDPQVRLLAHMSDRQLGLHQMIVDEGIARMKLEQRLQRHEGVLRLGVKEFLEEIQALREDLKLPVRKASAPLLRLLHPNGAEEAVEAASLSNR